jgi:AcrR family transcriptional regulator
MSTHIPASPVSPRRGRPPQTTEQAEKAKARITEATIAVFTDSGSRGLSVTRIIDHAGISRPTFYRYFTNATEPLHAVLEASNDHLITGIRAALEKTTIEATPQLSTYLIDAYMAWARSHGPMLRSLFAELHDPASPVSAYREQALGDIRTIVEDRFTALDYPGPAPLDLDAALHICEYLLYRVATGTPPGTKPTPESITAARATMTRLIIATLSPTIES